MKGLSWRQDLALPIAVAVLQLAGGFFLNWHRHHLNQFEPAGWVLLVLGPLGLAVRPRHPVAALSLANPPTQRNTGGSAA